METNNRTIIEAPVSGELVKGVLTKVYSDPVDRRNLVGIAEILDERPLRGLVNKECRVEMRKVRFINMYGEDLTAEEPCYVMIRVERNKREEGICRGGYRTQ